MCADIKKLLEQHSASEAIEKMLKPNPAIQKLMGEMDQPMARVPAFDFPSVMSSAFRMPEIPRMQTQEEVNEYQSASVLMQALAEEALAWKNRLQEDYAPAILAILYGGIQIHVQTLSQVSFHGIRIEGTMNGAPCSLLAHQSTVQLLCYAEKANSDFVRNPIGFVWDNHKVEV